MFKAFVDNAKHPEWIEWLDKNKVLENLFNNSGDMSDIDRNFAWWLINAFADKHYSHLFKLFDKHGMKLNKVFWSDLAIRIFANGIVKDKKAMHLWAKILIDTKNEDSGRYYSLGLSHITRYCARNNLYDLALAAFESMVTWKIRPDNDVDEFMKAMEEGEHLEQEKPKLMLNAEPYLACVHHDVECAWENGLKPSLDKIADPLFEIVIKSMRARYAITRTREQEKDEFDAFSYRRSAIEEHEQDRHPAAVNVIIDCARDCLEWIAVNNQDLAILWYKRLITSDMKILQRLAIHVLPFIKGITAGEKIDYLVNDISLHDIAAHHEIYIAIGKLYPDANTASRQKVIDLILEYEWQHSDDLQERKLYSVRFHYDLIEWISRKAPSCDLAAAALARIKSTPEYSYFEPKDHPEFTHYTRTLEPVISPIDYKQLLSNAPDYWYPQLVAVDKDNKVDIFAFGNELIKHPRKILVGYMG